MKQPTVLNAYLFIYKQRLKKIRRQYQLAFAILIDWITLIYMIPFFIVGIVLLKEFIQSQTVYISGVNEHNYSVAIVFSFLLFLFYLLKSIFDPRYKITSSDFNLSLLTYDLEKVLKIIVCHEQLKRALIFSLFSVTGWLLGLATFETMFLLIITFIYMDLFSGLVQWKLFQKEFKGIIVHLIYTFPLTIMLLLVYINYLKEYAFLIFLSISLVVLLFLSFTFSTKLSLHVNWNQVVPIGDDKTWNLLIVKLITGVGFNTITNRHRQTRLSKKRVEQLPYELSSIISTYWKQHFLLNKSSPFNILGNGIAILIFLSVNSNLPIGLQFAIPALIAIYLLYGIFNSKLDSMHYKVIPVPGRVHVKGYYRVTQWFIVLLLLPHCLFLLNTFPFSIGEICLLLISEWLLASLVYKTILHMSVSTYLKVKEYTKGHHLLIILLYLLFHAFIGKFLFFSVLAVITALFIIIRNQKNNISSLFYPFRRKYN